MIITKFLAQFHPAMDPALKKLGFENGLGLSVRGSPKLTSTQIDKQALMLKQILPKFCHGGVLALELKVHKNP
jgi:hypothetical protein